MPISGISQPVEEVQAAAVEEPMRVRDYLHHADVKGLMKGEKSPFYGIFFWGNETCKLKPRDAVITDLELKISRVVILALKAISLLFIVGANVGVGFLTTGLPYLAVAGIAAALGVAWGAFAGLKAAEKTAWEVSLEGSAKLYACYDWKFKILEPVRSVLYDVGFNGAAVLATFLCPPIGCIYGGVTSFMVTFSFTQVAVCKLKHCAIAFCQYVTFDG